MNRPIPYMSPALRGCLTLVAQVTPGLPTVKVQGRQKCSTRRACVTLHVIRGHCPARNFGVTHVVFLYPLRGK